MRKAAEHPTQFPHPQEFSLLLTVCFDQAPHCSSAAGFRTSPMTGLARFARLGAAILCPAFLMPHACLCNTALASLAPAVCVPCCKPSLPSILPFFQPSLLPGMLAVPLCFVKSATPAKLGPPQRRTASQNMSPPGKPAAVKDSGGFTCQQGGWGAGQLPLLETNEPSGWPNVGSRVWVTGGRRARGGGARVGQLLDVRATGKGAGMSWRACSWHALAR